MCMKMTTHVSASLDSQSFVIFFWETLGVLVINEILLITFIYSLMLTTKFIESILIFCQQHTNQICNYNFIFSFCPCTI